MSINERGCLQLTAYGNTGTSLSSIFIGDGSVGASATSAALRNIAIGHKSTTDPPGFSLTTGDDNILIGTGAGRRVSQGSSNIVIGQLAGDSLTSGSSNVLIGANAGNKLTGSSVVFVGPNAGSNTVNESQSTGVGVGALNLQTSGSSNTAIGYGAGGNLTTTSNNTFVGLQAGSYLGASPSSTANQLCVQCVYLGSESRSIASGGATNEIVIGYSAVGNGSNSVTLGNENVTNTYLRGDINLVEGGDVVLGTSTGTQIGTSASQKLAFYGDTPNVQPDTSITGATVTHIGGGSVGANDTFGGYTIGQIVAALQRLGLLA